MLGHVPGPMGFAAFAGVKFAGYSVAGSVLRCVYPATIAHSLTIGITRTVAGLALGIVHVALWQMFLSRSSNSSDSRMALWFFLSLLVLRLIIWTFIVWFFCDRKWDQLRRTLISALAGTALSFLLDFLGVALALVSPGQIPFC
jgi:hypothetical protein